MVTENAQQHYWNKGTEDNFSATPMSRTLMMLDTLERGGLHSELSRCRRTREEQPSIDPESLITSSIFRKRRHWWITYRVAGRKVIAPLRTRYEHIARIKQDEIEAVLASRSPALAAC